MPTKGAKRQQKYEEDNLSRVLQIVGIVAVVALVAIDTLVEGAEVPLYVTLGILGVAIGLKPEQIGQIIKGIFIKR